MFLGIQDFGIISAYILCIISAIICVLYGILNWNKGGDEEQKEILEETQWEAKQEE